MADHRELLNDAMQAFSEREFSTLVRVAEQAASSARADFGAASEQFREALHLLAVGYFGMNHVVIARALFEWLVRTGDTASTLTARCELAHCMMKEDDDEQGLALLCELIPEFRKNRPLLLAEALNSIGNTLFESGHPEDALPLHQIVEQVRQAAGDSRKLTECLYNLGSCHHALGEDAEAVDCLTQALDGFRKDLGEAHFYVGEAAYRLGVSYHRLGDYLNATAAYRVVIRATKLTSSDADTSQIIDLLRLAELGLPPADLPVPSVPERLSPFAALTHGMDRATARQYGAIVRRFLSRDYVGCAEHSLRFLGGCPRYDIIQLLICCLERIGCDALVPAVGSWAVWVSNGTPYQHVIRFVIGEMDLANVRELVGDRVGPNVVDMALAFRLNSRGDIDEADGYLKDISARSPTSYQGILTLAERHFLRVGPELPSETQREVIVTLVSLLALGQDRHNARETVNRLTARERYDEAIAVQQQFCEELEPTAEVDPIPYGMALNNLAHILFSAGRYSESLPYYERSVELISRVPEAKEAGDTVNNLGNTYLELDRAADAVRCQERAITLRMKSYGHHPRVLLGFLDLALAYRNHDASQQRSVYERAIRYVEDGLRPRYPKLVSQTVHAVSYALAKGDVESAYQTIRDVMLTWEGIDEFSHTSRDLLAAGIAEDAEGDAERAQSFFELAIDGAAESGDANLVAAALIELGGNEFRAGRLAEAMSLATRADKVVRDAGEDPFGIAGRSQLLVAKCVLKEGGDTLTALELLAKVTEVGSDVPDGTHIAARLLAAETHLRRGHTPLAIEELNSAVCKTGALSAPAALTALGSIGVLFQSCDAAAKVAECLAQAEALISSADSVDPSSLAAILSLRCAQAISAGKFERANEDCQRALGLLADAPSSVPALRSRLLEQYGLIAIFSRRDTAAAADAFALSLLELDKCPDDVDLRKARLRVTLAKTLMHRGDLAQASEAIRVAYEELEQLVESPHWLLADALGTSGKINLGIGARETAVSQLTRAREMFTNLFDQDHEFVINLNIQLSLLHAVDGRWAEALNLARAARSSLPNSDDKSAVHMCQRIESLASYALGDWESALQGLLDTLAGQIALFLRVARLANNTERVLATNSLKAALDELLAMAWESGAIDSPSWSGVLFLAAVRTRRLATEMLSLQEAALRDHGDHEKWAELRELRMLHARTALANPTGELDEQDRKLLKALQDRIDRLEVECYASIPEVFSSSDLDRITVESLAARLELGQALVVFTTFPAISPTVLTRDVPGLEQAGSRYVAFVLRASGADAVRIVRLASGSEIENAVKDFTGSLRAGCQTSSAAGVLVSEQLLGPLLPELQDITSLLIVPDGCLYSLPFGTVPTTDGQLLADQFVITYLESARDLFRVHASSSEAAAPVVMANPDYELALPPASTGLSQNAVAALRELIPLPTENSAVPVSPEHPKALAFNFPPLRGADEEGKLVAGILGTVAITGANALKTRFTSLSSPRVLHLATHGYYIPIRRAPGSIAETIELVSVPGEGSFAVKSVPSYFRKDGDLFHETRIGNPMLRTGLALAGANAWVANKTLDLAADDGIVSSADISAIDLRSTELVVLSACETGLGEINDIEGVMGIRRAFLIAGTKSLICSLWKVPDEETRRLMECMYTFLSEGTPPAHALHFAQNQMRAKGLDPFAWAAFIHIGQF